MAYAAITDMVSRFGEVELIRLTTPDGQDAETVQADIVTRALGDATDLIDSYLRKRYLVPLDVVPASITRATCMLARYDLSMGEQREPAEQTRLARKEVIAWLTDIADGRTLLDLDEIGSGDDSYARTSDRRAPLRPGCF